jgi:hypothetical protein
MVRKKVDMIGLSQKYFRLNGHAVLPRRRFAHDIRVPQAFCRQTQGFMIDFWRSAIQQQFHAAIDMLANALEACPESVWFGEARRAFWYPAFHVPQGRPEDEDLTLRGNVRIKGTGLSSSIVPSQGYNDSTLWWMPVECRPRPEPGPSFRS